MTGPIFRWRLLIIAAAALGLGSARAQQAESPDPQKEFLARQVARLALLDLRFAQAPTPEAYRLAELLIGIAHEQLPADEEILRREIEAAANAHDDPSVLSLSRELLNLNPKDTVVELRLIIATVAAAAQDADSRLAQYERFISGDKSKYFDASVRSRLALDAAMLLRERGDDAGFIEKLKIATQLDPTHKEAAALAWTVFAQRRPDDAQGKMEMLQNVLMSDPMDASVHMSIAQELAAAGAYKAASRFQQNAVRILDISGDSGQQPRANALILKWQADGPDAVITEINGEVARAKDAAARQIRQLQEAGRPIANAPKPEDIRLTGLIQMVYVAANIAAGDQNATSAVLRDAATNVVKTLQDLQDPNKRGKLTEEQANAASLNAAIELETLRLWGNTDIDAARHDLETSKGIGKAYPDQAAVLDGWLALRSGNPAAAIEKLRPYASKDLSAGLAIGLAHEALAQPEQAKTAYRAVIQGGPISIPAAWARTRLLALGVQDDPKSVAAMDHAAAAIPAWIDDMVVSPRRFLDLTVRVDNLSPTGLDRTRITVSIRNASSIPLALGADRPLNSRLLFVPRIDTISGGPLQLLRAEVVDIDQRLRLMPNEQLTVTVWPDSGQTGWLLECLADRTVRNLWRVIQGFVPEAAGGFRPGPMCLSTETERVVRVPTPESSLDAKGLAQHIASEPVPVLMRLAGTLRADIFQPLIAPGLGDIPGKAFLPGPDEFKPAAEAFAQRYPTLDPVNRAIIVATIPHAGIASGMAPLDAVIRAETDPAILPLVLVTRVTDPADPLLAKARNSDDPRVKQTAELIAARLADKNAACYARLTGGAFSAKPEAGANPEGAATGAPPGAGPSSTPPAPEPPK